MQSVQSIAYEGLLSDRRGFRHALLAALVVVFAFAWFANLDMRSLFIPDEGRYAEIPREMVATGDWVTPRLNDLKYFEKPPLQYWMTAASFAVFGESEWAARLPAALLGFLAMVMTGLTARRLWSPQAGLLAACVLGSNWGFYLSGQYLTLDMTLSALLGMALCGFLLAQRDDAAAGTRRNWMLFAWAACALAVLAKGLIGVVLPALTLVVYTVAARDWRIWLRLYLLPGIALFLLITAPWFLLVQQRNPEFFHFFFIYEHFQRYALSGHSRAGAWWYYLPILLLGLMPWTPALLATLFRRGDGQSKPATFRADWFCAAWALSVIVFFSVSRSKLPAYVIPAFPAIAMLFACRLRALVPALKWSAWTLVVLSVLLLIGVEQLPSWRKFAALGPEGQTALPLLYSGLAILLCGGLAAIALLRRCHSGQATLALAASSFVCWGAVFLFLQHTEEAFSAERLATTLTHKAKPYHPELPFYSVEQFDHSLPFYLGRPLTLVATGGELSFGIRAEPEKAIETLDDFRAQWNALDKQAFASLTPARYEAWQQEGVPMRMLVRDQRLVIVSRLP